MSEDWAAIAAGVAEGLLEAGTGAFLVRTGENTGLAHNPTIGAAVEHACTVVYDQWASNLIDGTLIKIGDRKLLVAVTGLTITPQIGDGFREVTDGKIFEVIAPLEILAPAGVPVLYTLNVRG